MTARWGSNWCKYWFNSWRSWRLRRIQKRRAIDELLWQATLAQLPFLQTLSSADTAHLRLLCSMFLDEKEFTGAQGLVVTDAQAVLVAAQACLPILHIAPRDEPQAALAWYSGFVGIVLQPGEVRARREWTDDDGITHQGYEELTGEALDGGPLMLAWSDVNNAGQTANEAYNVVIHEFIHVMDMKNGAADGCPPMAASTRKLWLQVMTTEYKAFCLAYEDWDRFGSLSGNSQPLLDSYASTHPAEFFAVAAEAYFVQAQAFSLQYPALHHLFDQFFMSNRPIAHEFTQ